MDKREDFNRMLADCRKGKIDKILVKSISRFARNTKDCLEALRELTSLGISVYFEEENIHSKTLTSELMVSVFGALAQQESVSISQNQRMSYQRRMERGEFITCTAPFGYQLVDGKRLEIVEKEVEMIHMIFNWYLAGYSTAWIAAELSNMGVPTVYGRGDWREETICKILENEKYIGDSLCQKTYTTNAFPFVQKCNHGNVDQYYVEQTHPAIISKEEFERVQKLRSRKSRRQSCTKGVYPLTLKIICGRCGTAFTRRATPNGYVSWGCRKHDRKASDCSVGRIAESELYNAFMRMYNKLKTYEDIILTSAFNQLNDLNDALQRGNPAMLAVNKAIAETAEQCHKISILQTRGLLDADACAVRLREINNRLTELRRERRQLLKNEELEETIEALRQTADIIRNGPERLDGFNENIFSELVEKIVAESQTRIRFRLYGNIEITEELLEGKR